jgi:hypothetical protein
MLERGRGEGVDDAKCLDSSFVFRELEVGGKVEKHTNACVRRCDTKWTCFQEAGRIVGLRF